MRRFNALVFDEVISRTLSSTTNITTSPRYASVLGQFDALVIQAVVDDVDAVDTLFVYQQHSSDARTWNFKNNGLQIFTVPMTIGATTSGTGMDLTGVPNLAYVRLLLTISSANNARVRLYVAARDAGGETQPAPFSSKAAP